MIVNGGGSARKRLEKLTQMSQEPEVISEEETSWWRHERRRHERSDERQKRDGGTSQHDWRRDSKAAELSGATAAEKVLRWLRWKKQQNATLPRLPKRKRWVGATLRLKINCEAYRKVAEATRGTNLSALRRRVHAQ